MGARSLAFASLFGVLNVQPFGTNDKKKNNNQCPNVDLRPVHHSRFLSTEIREWAKAVDCYAAQANDDACLWIVSLVIQGNSSPYFRAKAAEASYWQFTPPSPFWCVAAVLNIPSPDSVGPTLFLASRPPSKQSRRGGPPDARSSSETVPSRSRRGPVF